MRFGNDIIGKPIVSIDDGRFIGEVRDLYVDTELRWLAGVHLGKEGLISRKSLLIARDRIVVFGIDVMLAKTAGVVSDDKATPEATNWILLDDLRGREVDTPGGTKVGTIGDLLIGEGASVAGFSLSRVFVEGPIADSRTILRNAVVDTGQEDGVMTIDLAKVEQQSQEEETVN